MQHSVLGTLTFKYGWEKPLTIQFNHKTFTITAKFSAFEQAEVTPEQVESYQDFTQNQANYENEIQQLLESFISKNQILSAIVTPRTLLFQRNGDVGLLCDCSWDEENGIAVVLKPKQEVVLQDLFL